MAPRNATEVTDAVPAGSAVTVTDSGRTIANPVPESIESASAATEAQEQPRRVAAVNEMILALPGPASGRTGVKAPGPRPGRRHLPA